MGFGADWGVNVKGRGRGVNKRPKGKGVWKRGGGSREAKGGGGITWKSASASHCRRGPLRASLRDVSDALCNILFYFSYFLFVLV